MPFEIIRSEEISHRTDFPLLCNARGYVDAVEVGVDLGVFAVDFLRRFEGNWLYLVDPYQPFPEHDVDRSLDAMTAVLALMPFHGRFRFIRHPSPDAIRFCTHLISPQFVYVDGAHDFESVYADLCAWWEVPSVQMIGGHDWDDHEAHAGVKAAVTRFAREREVVVRLTHESGPIPASYYCYRHEPANLMVRLFRSAEEGNPHWRP